MQAWTCNCFEGYWPVGTAAVVIADNIDIAKSLLEDELSKSGLTQEIQNEDLIPLPTKHRYVRILCDGDY